MKKKEIDIKIKELKRKYPDVHSIGYGRKRKNGEFTGELGLVFSVEKKKNIEELTEEELIPNTIELDNENFITDVIEESGMKVLACDSTTQNQCLYMLDSEFWNPTIISNRTTIRPLKGGVSMTRTSKKGSGVGTLGFLAVDKDTGGLVAISNLHVTNTVGLIATEYNLAGYPGNRSYSILQEQVYQTGEPNANITEAENIGRVKNYVPLYLFEGGGYNTVDAAAIVLKESIISFNESYKIEGLTYANPMEFATTQEIDSILVDDIPLYSSGRSTGPKEDQPCGLVATQLNASSLVSGYGIWRSGFTAKIDFYDCIRFERYNSDCPSPIIGGDSGSVLIGNFNGVSKIIGLCFAGSTYSGLACRIDRVATQLNIEAWDGSSVPFLTESPQVHYEPGLTNDLTKVINGETYYQVGVSNT